MHRVDCRKFVISSKATNMSSQPSRFIKPIVIVTLLAIAGILYWRFGDWLSLKYLADQETAIRAFGRDHPVLVPGIAFGIYVLATGLSLPGAAVLTLVMGWYFGFARGLVLVSFASTTGATIAFLLSRYLFRETIENRFGTRMKTFQDRLRREGAYYLFSLRLIPAVPFFIVNLVMGLTPIRTRTYWWVSQLGMLPGTAVYVYAGSAVPSLKQLAREGVGGILTPGLIFAFVLLGTFPLLVKTLLNRMTKSRSSTEAKKP